MGEKFRHLHRRTLKIREWIHQSWCVKQQEGSPQGTVRRAEWLEMERKLGSR